MIFDFLSSDKRNSKKLIESAGISLSSQLAIIKKLIPKNKRVNEIDDIFSLGYTYSLCMIYAEELGIEVELAKNASIGILIGLFDYKSEQEQERMVNRIRTCISKKSKEYARGVNAASEFYYELNYNPDNTKYRWLAHIQGK